MTTLTAKEDHGDNFELSLITINLSIFNRFFPGFDIVDAAIISFILQMLASARPTIHRWIDADGIQWTRIHAGHIMSSLPILQIGTARQIQKRLKKILETPAAEGLPPLLERGLFANSTIPGYRRTISADMLDWDMPHMFRATDEAREARKRAQSLIAAALSSPYTSRPRVTNKPPEIDILPFPDTHEQKDAPPAKLDDRGAPPNQKTHPPAKMPDNSDTLRGKGVIIGEHETNITEVIDMDLVLGSYEYPVGTTA